MKVGIFRAAKNKNGTIVIAFCRAGLSRLSRPGLAGKTSRVPALWLFVGATLRVARHFRSASWFL
jgi:hypothetical protein